MKERFVLLVTICIFIFLEGRSQRVMEFGIKPTEAAFLNFEANAAIGNKKTRYGILLSYRPSTQDSGRVNSGGSGAAGGYGHRYLNKLYKSYTIGFYQKTYVNKALDTYLEADVFYRNWRFKNKHASFQDVEGYNFQGLRTENVDVYCLKLLIGQTIFLTPATRKVRLYLDVYGGLGYRYQEETYETFDGYVNDDYYSYKKDKFNYRRITPQGGVKFGLMIFK
ncbi:hypothetical protein A3860_03770 [Niastella vici]|uniref:DUF3575 domain-containing protein n=1 Tax=Niastella vici TaxID=1703345 RepID=A0A1V9FXN5_9BACT|nr:hypothetical protein [Niastella vici]OQP63102.1 hypothetical protein A3860_03770 [Niastella vici]